MKQGEKTRNHIIDVTDGLIYRRGYNNTSFADIVNETNLSKGNITYHFKNKRSILEAIVEKRLDSINKTIESWEETTSDTLQRLYLFCDMILQEQNNLKEYGCPMGTLTAEFSKYDSELHEIVIPLFKRYREWLREQFISLGFDERVADEKSMELLGRVQGIAAVAHAFKDREYIKREIIKLKDMMFSG